MNLGASPTLCGLKHSVSPAIDIPQGQLDASCSVMGGKMMRGWTAGLACVATAIVLSGCVATKREPVIGTAPTNKVWARSDGQKMSASPALLRQGQADLTQCRALAAVTNQPGQYDLRILNGCMTSRGYVERDL